MSGKRFRKYLHKVLLILNGIHFILTFKSNNKLYLIINGFKNINWS